MLIDVNWRPVFWDDQDAAPERIRQYVDGADILKLSDDEAEFIYGVGHRTALDKPEEVSMGAESRQGRSCVGRACGKGVECM